MKAIYFTLTGTKYEYGDKFMELDMSVSLVKEPDNKYDKEAIRVEMDGLGKVGVYSEQSLHRPWGKSERGQAL